MWLEATYIFYVHYFVNLSGNKYSLMVMLLMYYSFRVEIDCKISYAVFFSKQKKLKTRKEKHKLSDIYLLQINSFLIGLIISI